MVATSTNTGGVTALFRYGPFGEPSTADGVRLRYTGQQFFGDLGLYHYKARFYSPALGRFLQADPIGYGDGLNLYAYVGNDPLNRVDPNGLTAAEVAALGREFMTTADATLRVPGVQASLAGGLFGGGAGYLAGNATARVLAGAAATVMDLQGAADGVPTGIRSINPAEVRFSQSSVNGAAGITASMRANGWQGAPIDVVKMRDGALTTFDNTRLLAAQRAGINAQAAVHEAGEAFPAGRWTPRSGIEPQTWEEAIQTRIQQQNSGFRNTYPNGSPFTGSRE